MNYNAADRLLRVIERWKSHPRDSGEPIYAVLNACAKERDLRFGSYLNLVERLVAETHESGSELTDGRRDRLLTSLVKFEEYAFNTSMHHAQFQQFLNEACTDVFCERLGSLSEVLVAKGKGVTIDGASDWILETILSLNELSSEMERSDNLTEIDQLILARLSELRDVLSAFDIFGPSGAKSEIERVIGAIVVGKFSLVNGLSDQSAYNIRATLRILKGCLDYFVYGVTGVQAIEWTNSAIDTLLK